MVGSHRLFRFGFLILVFAASALWGFAQPAEAFQVKRVLRGAVTLANATTDEVKSVDLTSQLGGVPLDLTKSFLVYTARINDVFNTFTDAFGVIDEWALAKGEFWAGAIAREAYTLVKLSQEFSNLENPNEYFGRKILDVEHFIAFCTAWMPWLGNVSYLIEGLCSPLVKDKSLTKFMLYDSFSRLGEKFPIWGGRDTLTEHYSNHALDLIVKNRKSLNGI